jgi:hypothetical protein
LWTACPDSSRGDLHLGLVGPLGGFLPSWLLGGVGEFLALEVLYTGSERSGDRPVVFVMTLLLLAVVIVGPALGLWRVAHTKLIVELTENVEDSDGQSDAG